MNSPSTSYFLPYQNDLILEEFRLLAVEKSIRIGATFAMAFRAVRRRVEGRGDCLITSVSLPAAKEMIETCKKFNEIFKIAAGEIEAVSWGENLDEQGFCIRYPNGGRIFAFSSNPKSIRSFGGEVMIDEIAFHKDPKEMRKAAGGRAMWGYPVTIWSSHNGSDSDWNRFLLEERAKGAKSQWKIVTITLLDAIEAGLLDKINATSGLAMTKEQFIDQTKEMVGGEEAFEEECMCRPRKAGDSAIKWDQMAAAREDYELLRSHFATEDAPRVKAVAEAILEAIGTNRAALGYDVARTRDLAVVWVNRREGKAWRLAAMVTMRGVKFGTQRELVRLLMRGAGSLCGAGDATGAGMQVCEELQEEFGKSRFIGINFSAQKPDLGTRMQRAFEDGRQLLPAATAHDDVARDIMGIRQESLATGRIRFYETRNPLNKDSHCDMAWACALALAAGDDAKQQGVYFLEETA